MAEPGPGKAPIAPRRAIRDSKKLGGLLGAKSGEEAEFDEFRGARVFEGQRVEGLMDVNQRGFGRPIRFVEFLQVDTFPAAAMAFGLSTTRSIDENAAHGFRGGAEEVGAILPGGLTVASESEPGFVDEGGGLERLPWGLTGELLGCQHTEFVVDQWQEPLYGLRVVALERGQHFGHFTHG